ncbi:MAG: cytochrome c oxidase accessory protein CcoG, partial [Spongiibacter marinus]|uniref:cytochrome c oxidase accessory protein CcoG n=1 Tax=Spongiibacter marinus TaxID=354246 RepID=UPI003C5531F2
PAEVGEIDLYQKREKIYTRAIEGFYQRIRVFTGWPLLLGYIILPWLNWDGRQSVLFDLPARQFHVLGLTFWPQDMTMLAWVLIIAAFGLFAVTNLAGRVWCGYSCPQTVWTSIFMWMEQKAEGTRNQRIKLDAAPWSFEKLRKKAYKHSMWLGFAFLTGFTFVGYFTPVRELAVDFIDLSANGWAFFWIAFFTAATYLNAGWMREQVCMYMCPYARFQSAMFDPDTLIISYDSKRGEPRGSRKREAQSQDVGLGDCIDCQLCVQVCPTGIDIRDGLQYECIGCALCVDACNSVMDKMGYEPGLIRYATENSLKGKKTHIMRPRLLGYVVAMTLMVGLLAYNIADRDVIELSVLRDRQALFTEVQGGMIENSYTVKIANKTQQEHRYQVVVESEINFENFHKQEISLQSGELLDLPMRLQARADSLPSSRSPITISVRQMDKESSVAEVESSFFGPVPQR